MVVYNMKVRWILVMGLCLLMSCKKGIEQKVTDFSDSYHINTSYTTKDSLLRIDVELKKGIHAYALGEKIGKPISLEVINKNGWVANDDAILPKGLRKNLGSLGSSMVLENQFSIEQKLIKGKGHGIALLHMQVCSDNTCDKPRSHKIIFGE